MQLDVIYFHYSLTIHHGNMHDTTGVNLRMLSGYFVKIVVRILKRRSLITILKNQQDTEMEEVKL